MSVESNRWQKTHSHSQHNWAVNTEVESPWSKKKLAYHMGATHVENQTFHCDLKSGEIECSYHSSSRINLRTHKKRAHKKAKDVNPPKFLCDLCDYSKTLKTNLVRHNKTCTNSVEPNSIENSCNFCRKTFTTKKILHKHTKLNNKEKTFAPNCTASCVV